MTRPRNPGRWVLPLCFLAYTCSYLCRTNYSVALPQIAAAFDLSRSMSGLIGTAYFWMYAIGQLINGALSERVDPKRFVAIGLFASAALNVAIGVSGSAPWLVLLWGLNGYSLSMLWCAMVRILTDWYQGEAYNRASFIISLPTTLGYVLSWGALGALLTVVDWRWAFFLPAGITFVFLLAWMFLPRKTGGSEEAGESGEAGMEDSESRVVDAGTGSLATGTAESRVMDVGTEPISPDAAAKRLSPNPPVTALPSNPSTGPSSHDPASEGVRSPAPAAPAHRAGLRAILLSSFFLAVALIAIAQGLIKESINLWSPTILAQVAAPGLIPLLSMLVPIAGTAGILLTARLMARVRRAGDVLLLLMAVSLLAAAGLWLLPPSAAVTVSLLGILLAAMSGNNTIITGILPLRYLEDGRCAQISGVFNFMVYVGASLGGVATGAASAALGWGGMYAMWGALVVLSLGLVFWRREALNHM